MRILIWDINNFNYWVKNIGFDGYSYLLFLRKIINLLLIYFAT